MNLQFRPSQIRARLRILAGVSAGASNPMISGEGEFINLGNEFRRTYRDAAKRGGPNLAQQQEANDSAAGMGTSHRLNRSPRTTGNDPRLLTSRWRGTGRPVSRVLYPRNSMDLPENRKALAIPGDGDHLSSPPASSRTAGSQQRDDVAIGVQRPTRG